MYRILIVDDETIVRQGIIARLNHLWKQPLSSREASDGRQALEIIQTFKPQIIITDIRMPHMDGLSFIRAAKDMSPSVQFIILSGYAEFEYAKEAMTLGVIGYLVKPISSDTLLDMVDQAVQRLETQILLNHVKHENEQMRAELVAMDGQQKFFRLLNLSKESQPDQVELLNRQLFQDNSHSHILALMGMHSMMNPDRLEKIMDRFRNLFQQNTPPMPAYLFPCIGSNNRFYIVFGCLPESGQTCLLSNYLEKLLVMSMKNNGEIWTAGLSEPCYLIDSKALAQATQAFCQRLAQGNGHCYAFHPIDLNDYTHSFENDLSQLRNAIDRMDTRVIESRIQQMFSGKHPAAVCPDYIWAAWFRIVSMLMQLSTHTNSALYIPKESFGMDQLERFRDKEEFITYLYQLIIASIRHSNVEEMKVDTRIDLAIEYIRTHYQEELTLNDLSYQYALSPNYFSATFKKATGMGVVNYITKLRMDRACSLLRDTDWSVGEIARSVGYSDSQYFFRVFKKYTDVTPLQYKKDNWLKEGAQKA